MKHVRVGGFVPRPGLAGPAFGQIADADDPAASEDPVIVTQIVDGRRRATGDRPMMRIVEEQPEPDVFPAHLANLRDQCRVVPFVHDSQVNVTLRASAGS
jgi:hypothetical protein